MKQMMKHGYRVKRNTRKANANVVEDDNDEASNAAGNDESESSGVAAAADATIKATAAAPAADANASEIVTDNSATSSTPPTGVNTTATTEASSALTSLDTVATAPVTASVATAPDTATAATALDTATVTAPLEPELKQPATAEVVDATATAAAEIGSEKTATVSTPTNDPKTPVVADLRRAAPVTQHGTVASMLKAFTDPELLTGSNKFACKVCFPPSKVVAPAEDPSEKQKQKQKKRPTQQKSKEPPPEPMGSDATKQLAFYELPKVLVVHLKRFMQTNAGHLRKVGTRVEFPVGLDMKPYCASSVTGSTLYELYGVVEHSGSMDGGHYTAHVRCGHSGMWYYCSDTHVNPVTLQDVLRAEAYILFYEQRPQQQKAAAEAESGGMEPSTQEQVQ
eukprot:TRINITY_DN16770_c1_g1_i3.p2 TRINITY_DN16770_c1_g1~~TRINITY_DN16770_c1_g1_i3.p2  ORF type:complete len:396 (+),score=91.87 TRINITY_DN16770_c1_g1_i3:1443-2630(+)